MQPCLKDWTKGHCNIGFAGIVEETARNQPVGRRKETWLAHLRNAFTL